MMLSAFSRGDDPLHILLSCLRWHCIAVIGSIRKQCSGGYRIVYVARREKYTQRISKSINNLMNFACQSAPCTSDFLSEALPFAPMAC